MIVVHSSNVRIAPGAAAVDPAEAERRRKLAILEQGEKAGTLTPPQQQVLNTLRARSKQQRAQAAAAAAERAKPPLDEWM